MVVDSNFVADKVAVEEMEEKDWCPYGSKGGRVERSRGEISLISNPWC